MDNFFHDQFNHDPNQHYNPQQTQYQNANPNLHYDPGQNHHYNQVPNQEYIPQLQHHNENVMCNDYFNEPEPIFYEPVEPLPNLPKPSVPKAKKKRTDLVEKYQLHDSTFHSCKVPDLNALTYQNSGKNGFNFYLKSDYTCGEKFTNILNSGILGRNLSKENSIDLVPPLYLMKNNKLSKSFSIKLDDLNVLTCKLMAVYTIQDRKGVINFANFDDSKVYLRQVFVKYLFDSVFEKAYLNNTR